MKWFREIPGGFGRRVAPVYQISRSDCGAACLAMILKYHRVGVKPSTLRRILEVGRDGVSARQMIQVARQFGLEGRGYQCGLAALPSLRLPAILHWAGNHFVVLERLGSKHGVIIDPAHGRALIAIDQIGRHFHGLALEFTPGVTEPGPEQRPIKEDGGSETLRTIGRQMLKRTNLRRLATVVLTTLLLYVLGLALPAATKLIVDKYLPIHAPALIPTAGLALALLCLAQFTFSYIRGYALQHFQLALDSHVSEHFVRHCLSLRLAYYQVHSTGDLLSKAQSISLIREVMSNQLLIGLIDVFFVFGYMASLVAASPHFALVVALLAAVYILTVLAKQRTIKDLLASELQAKAAETSFVVQMLRGMATIKALAGETTATSRWKTLFDEYVEITQRRFLLSSAVDSVLGVVRKFSTLILLFVCMFEVVSAKMTIGEALALSLLGSYVLGPLGNLAALVQQLQLVSIHLARVDDLLEEPPEQEPTGQPERVTISGTLRLERVTFRYTRSSPLILRDVDMQVFAGERVGLVGRTGAGKSTLAMLILGMYRPLSGRIIYDGWDLDVADHTRLRAQMGVVLQEAYLFDGSVRENLTFGMPAVDDETIRWVTEVAAVREEIEQLPLKYDTILGENGFGLSGGQRQRLALARALLRRPKVLLLDEATNQVDPITEDRIRQQLGGIGCTQIVISHRMSTIRACDRIYVVERGSIADSGTHDELVLRSPLYRTLLMPGSETVDEAASVNATATVREP